jgi:protein TonB
MKWSSKRLTGAFSASLVFHAGLVMLLVAILTSPQLTSLETEVVKASLAYVRVAGNGGGGGGGNRPDQPQRPPQPERTASRPEPAQAPPMIAFPVTAATHPLDLPGTFTGLSVPVSLAPAGPGGGGNQPGPGSGGGRGPGDGPGAGGNTGGDEYQIGDNVTTPEVIYEKRPTYTPDALLARLQGVVEIEAVVLADGSVARPRIIRSLDRGLDQRAIEAVLQWRFKPGRRRDTNQPVNVVVRIHLTFLLR